jgi:Fumarate reductase flavoprotein C-term
LTRSRAIGTLRADHRTNKRHDTTVPRRGGVPTSVLECDLEHLCGVGDIGVIRPLGQQTLGLGSLLDLAACMVEAGMARKESRGAHSRPDDYPARDDEGFLKHSIVRWADGRPRLDSKPVTMTKWQPDERKY